MLANNKKMLNEMEIRANYITPAIKNAGWIFNKNFREEYPITNGRITATINIIKRNNPLRADYVLFYRPNIPLAVVEAKDNKHNISDGMQQALKYAALLDIPFAFSSNGDGFIFHNKFVTEGDVVDWKKFPQALIVSEKAFKCDSIVDKLTDVKELLKLLDE